MFYMLKRKEDDVNKTFIGMNLHWPSKYRGRRDGVWVLKMPNGTLQTFHIRVYGGNRSEEDPIMRISDDYRPHDSKGRVYFKESAGSGIGKDRIELNFLASESEEVFSWFFNNYTMVKELPVFMSEKRRYCFPKTGDVLSGYLWTDKADQTQRCCNNAI